MRSLSRLFLASASASPFMGSLTIPCRQPLQIVIKGPPVLVRAKPHFAAMRVRLKSTKSWVTLSVGKNDEDVKQTSSLSSALLQSMPGFLRRFSVLSREAVRDKLEFASHFGSIELPDAAAEASVHSSELSRCFKLQEDEEIVSIAEDDMDSSVVWEQRKKDVRAEQERHALMSPGFSFSAAGLLFPYHLGVTQCLVERNYITENTPLAGSSAGALVCAVIASGLCMHDAMLATKELAHDCRTNGTAFRLGAVLKLFLEKCLPHDAHIRANGRIRVAITQVFRSPRGLLVDQFNSKADLIAALHTSCFIPGYLAPRPVTLFRNRICIDGGLTLFMPPTAADVTIRVCAFPSTQLGLKGVGISPDCNPCDRASTRQLLNWALEPAEDNVLDDLFKLGYQDALLWTSQHALSEFRTVGGNDELGVPGLSVS